MSRALGALLLCAVAGWAHAQSTPEALDWLRRIYQATETLSYTGTFVYQQGGRIETSRITRLAGAAGGLEKIEVLDGAPRQIVRTRDEVRCYLPDSKLVKVDRRNDPRAFPALVPSDVKALAEHYAITLGETDRIAGYACRVVVLAPKDDLRYGYRLWADTRTGMLLKAQIMGSEQETVEQFTFVQLEIGRMPPERLRPPSTAREWRVEQLAVSPVDLSRAGWSVGLDLPGFRKIVEIQRVLRDAQPVGQLVYSDGLAAVSIFIEPLTGRSEAARLGLAGMGAVNVVTREVANHLVTVVGETPAASVQRIADTVEYRPQ